MEFFPNQPKLVKADVERLLPHIANEKEIRKYLLKDPSYEEVCKCVLLEIERSKIKVCPLRAMRRGVFILLRKRQIQLEERIFEKKVISYLNQP